MSEFDLGGLTSMLGGFQQKLEKAKADASAARAEGKAGGGLVTAIATGDNQIVELRIADEAWEDKELLEDLIRAAVNESLRNVQAESAKALSDLTSGLLPPGMIPGL